MNRKPLSVMRDQLNRAKTQYLATSYDGDLADELLPPAQRRLVLPIAGRRPRWFMPLLTGAMAAMVAVIVWHRATRSPADPRRPVTPSQLTEKPNPNPATSTAPVAPNTHPDNVVYALKQIRYEAYVDDVRTGVHDAVDQMRSGVDRALNAPLVTTGVETVDQVTGDIKHMATATWSQMRAAKNRS